MQKIAPSGFSTEEADVGRPSAAGSLARQGEKKIKYTYTKPNKPPTNPSFPGGDPRAVRSSGGRGGRQPQRGICCAKGLPQEGGSRAPGRARSPQPHPSPADRACSRPLLLLLLLSSPSCARRTPIPLKHSPCPGDLIPALPSVG